jgi:hypothetical protein
MRRARRRTPIAARSSTRSHCDPAPHLRLGDTAKDDSRRRDEEIHELRSLLERLECFSAIAKLAREDLELRLPTAEAEHSNDENEPDMSMEAGKDR